MPIRLPFYSPGYPQRRADCERGPRPCRYVACRHHLYPGEPWSADGLDASARDTAIKAMAETCSLDVADGGCDASVEHVAALMQLAPDEVRRIEQRALAKAAALYYTSTYPHKLLVIANDNDYKQSAPDTTKPPAREGA